MVYYLAQCVQLTYGDKKKVYLLDESALPVTDKEKRREVGQGTLVQQVILSLVPKSELHALWSHDSIIL